MLPNLLSIELYIVDIDPSQCLPDLRILNYKNNVLRCENKTH